MEQKIITRASELINSKTDYIGDGMEGHVVLSLLDEKGYPTSAAITLSKADGINWLSFLTGMDSNKVRRINKSDKACVCLATSEYNITLVGTIEIVTDPVVKEELWQDTFSKYYGSPKDPAQCALRFRTERYSIFFADDGSNAVGNLMNVKVTTGENPMPKLTPALGFKGDASQAIELYQKAFGAKVTIRLNYSDADPKDFQCNDESKKDCIYYAEMMIGNQQISFGDNPDGVLGEKVNDKASAISLLIEFDSVDELNVAYELMSEDATILVPMGATTYCTGYVSLVDKFGIQWDLMSGYVE